MLSIMQIKKTAADNASTEGQLLASELELLQRAKINDISRNLEEFNEWRRNKHHP